MNILEVTLKGITASFREPSSMSYQESVIFPPPTSIIGLLGAAFGFTYEEAYQIFRNIKIGIKIKKRGFLANDLWKINKIKNKRFEKAVISREIYFSPEYKIYIYTHDELLEEIGNRIEKPAYPLTLGRNEEIVNEIRIKYTTGQELKTGEIENVVLKGRLKPGEFELSDREKINDLQSFKTYELTQSFQFDNNIRRPWRKNTFTYIDRKGKMKRPVVKIQDENIPLWRCAE